MKKPIDERLGAYLKGSDDLIGPVIEKILVKIRESEDQQVKLEGIMEIILLVLTYY